VTSTELFQAWMDDVKESYKSEENYLGRYDDTPVRIEYTNEDGEVVQVRNLSGVKWSEMKVVMRNDCGVEIEVPYEYCE